MTKYVQSEFLAEIVARFPALSLEEKAEEQAILVPDNKDLLPLMFFLKEEHDFNMVSALTAVDYKEYFEVVYFLLAMKTQRLVCIKLHVADHEEPKVPAVTPLWAGANFFEREVYDMFGIEFKDHPDLRRLFMPDDFVGHPLRKDFVPCEPKKEEGDKD